VIPDRRLEDLTGNENRSSEVERRKGTQCGSYHGCGRVVSQMILAASGAGDGETTENHSVPSPSTTTTSIAIEFRLRSRFRSTVYDTIDEVQKWSWAA
jgi:hypothetical protein